MMKTKERRQGVSLIVLIVIIILAAVVILTLSKNNSIESAKEARFKEDIRTFQDELALYISKQYANAGGHWDGNIRASKYDDIINYIPSFSKKYEGKLVIENNSLEYTDSLEDVEKEYVLSLNIKEKKNKILPNEYQQVEYIESTATQYIDTNIIPKSYTKVFFDFSFDEYNTKFAGNGWVSTNSKETFTWGHEGNEGNFCSSVSNTLKFIYTNVSVDTNRHTWSLESGKQLFDEKLYGESILGDGSNFSMYLFARHIGWRNTDGNFVNGYCKEKLYLCQIFENNIMIRNFIPCYSTTIVTDVNEEACSKGTVGLYDLVEGKFYTNQGAGEDFKPGPEV